MYQEVESIDELYKTVEQCLEEYNQTHKTQMNLVIFRSNTVHYCTSLLVWETNADHIGIQVCILQANHLWANQFIFISLLF